MTTIVPARASWQITTSMRNASLMHVLLWELRRFQASRLFWFQALGFFCFLLFLIWILHSAQGFAMINSNGQFSVAIAGTSARGLLHTLPISLLVLVLFVPFVAADGVTRDRSQRTQELLLTTVLPTWAYVWGRYLAGLMISLGLATLMLAAILGMGGLLHLTIDDYPSPPIGAVLLLWVGLVFPATVLVNSFCFALSTLWPRLSTLVKVMMLVVWIVGTLVLPRVLGNNSVLPAWYVNWDPTSGGTTLWLVSSYSIHFSSTITSEAQLQPLVLSMEDRMPVLAGWFASHLLLAVFSLFLVLIAAFAFKRTHDALS